MTTERSKIQGISVRAPQHRLRNALIGMAIGAGVGLAVDRSLGVYLRNESNPEGAQALIWAVPIAIGGGVGAALPAQCTIYRR